MTPGGVRMPGRRRRGWAVAGMAVAVALVLAGVLAVMRGPAGWPWPGQAAPDAQRVYKQVGATALRLDIFHGHTPQPAGNSRPPALLLFHGGAWAHGSPAQFHPQCRHFSRLGLTCISVEYRVRSRHGSTPADALADARDALAYVRRQADALRVDPRRVAAGGGSAGGHLAAALGVGLPRAGAGTGDGQPARPDALLLFNPMLDLSPGQPDHDLVGLDWRGLSPLHHVGPGMPPTLVLNGTADREVPVDTVQRFCRAVQQAGATCELALFEGGGHGFFNPQVDQGRHHGPANAAVESFLRRLQWL